MVFLFIIYEHLKYKIGLSIVYLYRNKQNAYMLAISIIIEDLKNA